jgi:hypothetical protein
MFNYIKSKGLQENISWIASESVELQTFCGLHFI